MKRALLFLSLIVAVLAGCKKDKPKPVIPLTDFKFTSEIVLARMGLPQTLTIMRLPENTTDTTVRVTSSDETVATVSRHGIIEAKKLGKTTVTVTNESGTVTKTVVIEVVPIDAQSITLDNYEMELEMDKTGSLTATVNPTESVLNKVVWTSSKENIATVAPGTEPNTVIITPKALGYVYITATSRDDKAKSICRVHVINTKVKGITLDLTQLDTNVGSVSQLTATVTPDNAFNKAVTWSSSDVAIASVSPTGLVISLAEGQATITAATADGTFKAECKVTVKP